MNSEDLKRKLVAILSADVRGYSRLMSVDEEATVRMLSVYKEVMGNLIRQYGGRVVDAPGDNLLAEFSSVVDAVQCAVEVQKDSRDEMRGCRKSGGWSFGSGSTLGMWWRQDRKSLGME